MYILFSLYSRVNLIWMPVLLKILILWQLKVFVRLWSPPKMPSGVSLPWPLLYLLIPHVLLHQICFCYEDFWSTVSWSFSIPGRTYREVIERGPDTPETAVEGDWNGLLPWLFAGPKCRRSNKKLPVST